MRTTPFSCGCDSGQVGWIYIDRETGQREWGRFWRKKAEKYLIAEVEEYDQYLRGDVWGYTITDKDGNEVDGCWGFYGYDYAVQEAKGCADWHYKRSVKQHLQKIKMWIRSKVDLQYRHGFMA